MRVNLREHPTIQREIEKFWEIFPKVKKTIAQGTYSDFFIKVYKVLRHDFDLAEAQEVSVRLG